MKIKIESDSSISENEIIIRCPEISEEILSLQKELLKVIKFSNSKSVIKLTFIKEDKEFFFPLDDVLFFETDGNSVFGHTKEDSYLISYRLYELEELLPLNFVRIAKSAIVNVNHIFSVTRNITSSSQIKLSNTHKTLYVSRYYYKDLKSKLMER